MAQRLLHGVIDAKILEATLSVTAGGQAKPGSTPKPDASKNSMMTKVLSLIEKLPWICNCLLPLISESQRFEMSSDIGQHAAGKSLYATISIDAACVGRTRAIDATNDPRWKEEPFHIYCAHDASDIVFTIVRDDGSDPACSATAGEAALVGHAYLPVEDIVGGQQVDRWLPICDDKRKPLDGLDRIHVQLRFTDVSADPAARWGKGIFTGGEPYSGVPRTFFGQHRGCRVTLYQDAHVLSGNRCWVDIFDAITSARRLVYIAGWCVDADVTLVRDPRRPSETLGQLLKKKAAEGVTVLILVWDDGAPSVRDGLMATATCSKDTAGYFRGTGVHCVPCHRDIDLGGVEMAAMFTHHQKAMVVDGPRGLVSFLGGIDLCGGRYDTQEHPLFRTLRTTHRDDFHQPSFPGASIRKGGPREPWHDVHCRVDGPAAWDVLHNFEQRWRKQGGGDNLLVQPQRSSAAREVTDDAESWNVQVFRSIDSSAVVGFPESPDDATRCGLVTGKIGHSGDAVECSIQDAYVHAIRRAQCFIYIESQYFVGSSYGWRQDDIGGATSVEKANALHLIPKELSLKITSKIKAGERFMVYVVVPMWPESMPESDSVQAILHWQRRTMEMMYKDVALALGARGLTTTNPRDYLSFFCLGNRESYSGSEYSPPEKPKLDSDYSRAQQARRFKINVNSNMMIVDDDYIIVGSANINQRSMDGGRDSEIAMGAFQPRYLTTNLWARGQVYQFRLALWREHLGQAAVETYKNDLLSPHWINCVNRVNHIARQHWEAYASNSTFQGNLPGHLMSYPIGVSDRGELQETVTFFPDTKARVFGSKSDSLPPILTT